MSDQSGWQQSIAIQSECIVFCKVWITRHQRVIYNLTPFEAGLIKYVQTDIQYSIEKHTVRKLGLMLDFYHLILMSNMLALVCFRLRKMGILRFCFDLPS